MELISVVIPLYNKAPHIKRTLDSVLAQTYPIDEIIVIDDGSTDGGGEIVQAYQDPRIRYIRQENQGLSGARNRGIAEAKGELIALLDADDEWKPEFLETIYKLRKLYPEAGAYATAYVIKSPDGTWLHHISTILPPDATYGLVNNFFSNKGYQPIFPSAVAIPKKIFEEIGGFAPGLGEDTDLWIRIGIRYPIAWHKNELVIYYMDAVNRIYGFKKHRKEPAFSHTLRKALEQGIVPVEKVKDLREFVAWHQLDVIKDLIQDDQKPLARKILSEIKGTECYRQKGKKLYYFSYLPNIIINNIINIRRYIYKVKNKIMKNK